MDLLSIYHPLDTGNGSHHYKVKIFLKQNKKGAKAVIPFD
jgi:hypothetical protein